MRNLKDWLGKRVKCEGRIESPSKDKFLLVDVKIALYSSLINEIRNIDHLWCYCNAEEKKTGDASELTNHHIWAIGDVIQYTRKNGSKDYAIKRVPMLSMLEEMENFDKKPIEEQIVIIQTSLLAIRQRCFPIPINSTLMETKGIMERTLKSLQNSLYLRDKAIASQLRGDLHPDPVRFRSSKKEKVQGFK